MLWVSKWCPFSPLDPPSPAPGREADVRRPRVPARLVHVAARHRRRPREHHRRRRLVQPQSAGTKEEEEACQAMELDSSECRVTSGNVFLNSVHVLTGPGMEGEVCYAMKLHCREGRVTFEIIFEVASVHV